MNVTLVDQENIEVCQRLTLFRMGFFGAAHGWGALLPKICDNLSYNDESWHSYILHREDPKNI